MPFPLLFPCRWRASNQGGRKDDKGEVKGLKRRLFNCRRYSFCRNSELSRFFHPPPARGRGAPLPELSAEILPLHFALWQMRWIPHLALVNWVVSLADGFAPAEFQKSRTTRRVHRLMSVPSLRSRTRRYMSDDGSGGVSILDADQLPAAVSFSLSLA